MQFPGIQEPHRNLPNRTTLEIRLSTEKVTEIVFRVSAKARTPRTCRASRKKSNQMTRARIQYESIINPNPNPIMQLILNFIQ